MRRRALASATVLLLAGCGGGGGASPTSSTTTAVASTSSSGRASSSDRAEEVKAGRAAPFLEPGRDNSIPTFGVEATASRRRAAEAALRSYLAARAGGSWSGACARLAAPLARQIEGLAGGKGCIAAYRALVAGAPALSRADTFSGHLLSLRVEAHSAFALWIARRQQKYVMPMTIEDARWFVTQLAPIPYPLGSAPSEP